MEALLLDPYSSYASAFVRLLWEKHGVRTVALHNSWRNRIIGTPPYPELSSPAVSANYMIGGRSLADVAKVLRERHHIVAVVPHHELTVLPMHDLAVRLGLSWAQPDVIPWFRDKGSLKQVIAAADPGVRLNQTSKVSTVEQVREFLARSGAHRIVLKPNDGGGNVNVAFFNADVADEELASYLAEATGEVLAEEYVGGEEYFVNGQIDGAGQVHIVSVTRYVRVDFGGKENVEVGCRTLHTTDPLFEVLATYARRVLAATGLRRSPFHLEAKVDDRGPCLIEVGARLVGTGFAVREGRMHGGLDVLDLALSHYLHDTGVPAPTLDWHEYDSLYHGEVLGLASRDDVIYTLRGVSAVAAMPEFVAWVDPPWVGKKVHRTTDLISSPWLAEMAAASPAQLDAACDRASELITWNDDASAALRPLRRLQGGLAGVARKGLALAATPRLVRRTRFGWQ